MEGWTNHESKAVHSIPVARSGSLLSSTPPHLRNGNKRWGHTCLKGSQEESGSHKAGKVVRGSHARECDAPAEDHDARELAYRQPNKNIGQKRLHDQLCKIDDTSQPAVLVAYKSRIIRQTKHRGIRERGLVYSLEKIDKEHDRQDDQIDAAKNAPIILGRDNDPALGILVQKVGSDIAMLVSTGRMLDSLDGALVGILFCGHDGGRETDEFTACRCLVPISREERGTTKPTGRHEGEDNHRRADFGRDARNIPRHLTFGPARRGYTDMVVPCPELRRA
jgi:hypothetical protein